MLQPPPVYRPIDLWQIDKKQHHKYTDCIEPDPFLLIASAFSSEGTEKVAAGCEKM